MSPVSVSTLPGSALDAALAPVLASLPDDFTAAGSGEVGEVAVVDGRDRGWPARLDAALRVSRGVLLRQPGSPSGPAAHEEVRGLARRAREVGVPVVVDRRWSGAPGVTASATAFAEELAAATSVSVLLAEGDPARTAADALLDVLGLARAGGAAVAHLDGVHARAQSWSARGRTTGGAVVLLQGVRTAAGDGAMLTTTSARAWTSVHVPRACGAAPTTGRLADAEGERLLPTQFEAAERAAWRRLHQQLGGEPSDAGDELDHLADDLAVAAHPSTAPPIDRPTNAPLSASKEI